MNKVRSIELLQCLQLLGPHTRRNKCSKDQDSIANANRQDESCLLVVLPRQCPEEAELYKGTLDILSASTRTVRTEQIVR
jgi:hypothetical protein